MTASSLWRPRFAGTAVALLYAALSCQAWAGEPTAAQKETARNLMRTGRTARQSGDHEAARKAFAAANDIMHVPTTGLELARSQIELGLLVEARAVLAEVRRYPKKRGEPKPFSVARDSASELYHELDERIPSAKINLGSPPGGGEPEVAIDGVAFETHALDFPVRLDPGKHEVVAKTSTARATLTFTLAERDAKKLKLEWKREAAATSTSEPTELTPPPDEGSGTKRNYTIAYAGIGIGVVGLAVGGVGGGLALARQSNADALCQNGQCPPEAHDDVDAAKTWATVSTIGFVGAGAGALIAITGLIVAPRARVTKAETPGVTVMATPGGGMLRATF